MSSPIKRCVGYVIYRDDGKIFLMASPKWKDWVVPGGKINEGETEEEAVHREVKEELDIEVEIVYRVPGETVKPPSPEFKKAPETEFHFIDYYLRPKTTNITPNEEISDYGWFSEQELRENLKSGKITLMEITKAMIDKFWIWITEYNEAKRELKSNINNK